MIGQIPRLPQFVGKDGRLTAEGWAIMQKIAREYDELYARVETNETAIADHETRIADLE